MAAWLLAVTVAIIAIILYFIESPIEPQFFSYPSPPPELKGPLAVNTKLQKARRLFENSIFAPESFTADKNGNIYTGTGDGRIYRIKNDEITEIARTGEKDAHCGKPELQEKCGRPNGIRIDADGNLIVADAYKGLLKIILPSGQVKVLVSAKEGIQGVPFKFLNGLEISSSGIIYFTDSSSKWEMKNNRLEVLEMNNLGRLLKYDPKTGKTTLLMEDLNFPNGIALTQDESALLIAEVTPSRITKFYLKGPQKAVAIIVQDNLPGFPDNIRRNNKGNYFVGMSYTRFATWNPLYKFLDFLGPYPNIRKVLAKVTPNIAYDLCLPTHSIIVEINEDGKIISSMHDPEAKVIYTVSDAFEHDNKLYIGSFEAKFIGQLDLY